jgi:hypothetical protein
MIFPALEQAAGMVKIVDDVSTVDVRKGGSRGFRQKNLQKIDSVNRSKQNEK